MFRAALALILAGALAWAGEARAQSKRVWLRVFSSANLDEARRVKSLLVPSGMEGGRVRQAFLRRTQSRQGVTRVDVLLGPFSDPIEAALRGLALRRSQTFVDASIRLRQMAVLLPKSFLPLPLQVDADAVARFRKDPKDRYPALADLLVARAYAYVSPSHALPSLDKTTAKLSPWKPHLVLGATERCRGKTCLVWYRVLHPLEIREVYVPAAVLVVHRDKQRYKMPEAGRQITVRGALWRVGRAKHGDLYRVMFRRGSLPPQLHMAILRKRDKPPFRLVWDRHGPGIYNAEKKVVLRVKLRPWDFKRPPLWHPPRVLRRRRRQRATPMRHAMATMATMSGTSGPRPMRPRPMRPRPMRPRPMR